MMAYVQAPQSVQERRPSPNAPLQLKSNNPFRRAASPASPPAPHTPTGSLAVPLAQDDLAGRRISTNPFLDDYRAESAPLQKVPSPPREPPNASPKRRPEAPRTTGGIDFFSDAPPLRERPPTSGNISARAPPPRSGTLPMRGHHARSSNEERSRGADAGSYPGKPILDIFGNSDKGENRRPARPRRNSESSVMEAKDDTNKRRERRHAHESREGGDRSKSSRPREGRSEKSKRPNRNMDLIDKLDLTSIYGSAAFHHDGPFDACNPHRNRKGARRAPMQAFPEGSQNNALGGRGPVSSAMDYDRYHGRGEEGFTDYNATARVKPAAPDPEPVREAPRVSHNRQHNDSWDAKERVQQVHGPESVGLGTSTFLDGAPAPRAAIQRRESENETFTTGSGPGLTRKKSLAQKLRGISRPRPPAYGEQGRVVSPDVIRNQYSPSSPEYVGVQSAGGRGRMMVEKNPFFVTQVPGEKLESGTGGARVDPYGILDGSRARAGSAGNVVLGRTRTASSPHRGLARKMTNDGGSSSSPDNEGKTGGSGLLNRVKSLKGKKRPEPRAGVVAQ